MTSRLSVPVPSVVRFDLGASLDCAWAQQEGQLVGLPPGAKVALLAGRFEWRVTDAGHLPVSLIFVSGARRMVVDVTLAAP